MWFTETCERMDCGSAAEKHFISIATISGVSGGLVAIAFLQELNETCNSPVWIAFQSIIAVTAAIGLYVTSLNYSSTWYRSRQIRATATVAPSVIEKGKVEIIEHTEVYDDIAPSNFSFLPGLKGTILDLQCWLHAISFFTTSLPLYSFTTYFLPRIISRLSRDTSHSIPVSISMATFSTLSTIVMHYLVSRSRSRRVPLLLLSHFLALFGYVCLFCDFHFHYVMITLIPTFLYPSAALIYTWPAHSLPGSASKRATAGAIQVLAATAGGLAGVIVYKARPFWEIEDAHLWAAASLTEGMGIIIGLLSLLGFESGSEEVLENESDEPGT